MNKPTILGLVFWGVTGCLLVSCSGSKSNSSGSGGQTSSSGGSEAGGGPSKSDGGPEGGSAAQACPNPGVDAKTEDGGLVSIGASDPLDSTPLQEGGYYAMPSGTYSGYCFTYSDSVPPNTGTSTMYPPCGNSPTCFTQASGLCPVANLALGSTIDWGGGIGCNLGQAKATATATSPSPTYVAITGKTSMTISVTGCKVPAQLQLQLNVGNPDKNDAGQYGDGYYCKLTTLTPDGKGNMTATVQLNDLQQDCWQAGGPLLDPSTKLVASMQAQINALTTAASVWDFCVSKWTID